MIDNKVSTFNLRAIVEEEKFSNYSVLLVPSYSILSEQFVGFFQKVNYKIYSLESFEIIVEFYGEAFFPNCVYGDMDSIQASMKTKLIDRNVKLINCSEANTKIEKILYFCLEKLCDSESENFEQISFQYKILIRKHLFVCIDSEMRFDIILALYSDLVKFKRKYSLEVKALEIVIFSHKVFSLFLEEGQNLICLPTFKQCPLTHYSITALNGQSTAKVYESIGNQEPIFIGEKFIKFGSSFFFQKNVKSNTKIFVNIVSCQDSVLIFSFYLEHYEELPFVKTS